MWERYFPLEEKMNRLSQMDGMLAYLIFDCCRDNPCAGEDINAKMPRVYVDPVLSKSKAEVGELSSEEE